MGNINLHAGMKIRMYRKNKNMTLQQLADRIHKSRASVSKYETGEVSMDIETLVEIAAALDVSPGRILDIPTEDEETTSVKTAPVGMSPFFRASRLYFYFYDGRYKRLKDGIINIRETEEEPGSYEADLSISTVNPSGRSSDMP